MKFIGIAFMFCCVIALLIFNDVLLALALLCAGGGYSVGWIAGYYERVEKSDGKELEDHLISQDK